MPILGIGIGIFHFLLARHPRGPFVGCPPTMAKVGGLAGPKALNKPCKSEMGAHIHLGAKTAILQALFCLIFGLKQPVSATGYQQ